MESLEKKKEEKVALTASQLYCEQKYTDDKRQALLSKLSSDQTSPLPKFPSYPLHIFNSKGGCRRGSYLGREGLVQSLKRIPGSQFSNLLIFTCLTN